MVVLARTRWWGARGFDLVVGEEGREEATMDREEKVVGSMLKTREAVGVIWLGGMDREGSQGGCGRVAARLGTRGGFLGLSKID